MSVLTITTLCTNFAASNQQQFRALAQTVRIRVISPISWAQKLPSRRCCLAFLANRVATSHGIPVEYQRYQAPLPEMLGEAHTAGGIDPACRDPARQMSALKASEHRIRMLYHSVDAKLFSRRNCKVPHGQIGIPSEKALVLSLRGLKPVKSLDVLANARTSVLQPRRGQLATMLMVT